MKSLIFYLCPLLLTGCQKDPKLNQVIIDPDTSAVFTVRVPDTECPMTETNGSFLVGTPLTANENINIEVDVTKPGVWKYGTNTINGFYFSGSGNFTDTGKQYIILNALGTPVLAGNYFFTLPKSSSPALMPIAVMEHDILFETVPVKSYFKATIGGVDYDIIVATDGPDNISYGRAGIDTVSLVSFVGPGIYPNPPGTGTVSLQKGFIYNYQTSTETDFKNFFALAAHPYVLNKCMYQSLPGMILSWIGSDDKVWTTLKEFGDQAGSSFIINGIEDGYTSKGNYFVKVKSTFNCKLYSRTGEMTELTNGEMVSFFIK
jgi:hypothetical protein